MASTDQYLPELEDEAMEATEVDGALVSEDEETGDIIVDTNPSDQDDEKEESGHYENLASKMSQSDRIELGTDLIEMVKADEESRKKWKRRLLEGLEIIGVEEIPAENSAFDGSATVTHPAIAEAMVRFQANALEELFPAEGPVKTKVVGRSDPEKEDQAARVANFMNYQLTEADDEYFEHTDQMLMYLPYSGSAFKKVYYNDLEELTESRFVTAEDFIVPYDATSLKTAPRYTHRYKLTGNEVKAAIANGDFIESDALDFDSGTAPMGKENDFDDLKDTSDQKEESRAEDDTVFEFYEIHAEMLFDEEFDEHLGEGKYKVPLPYVLTVETESGEIMAIRRLWRENDPKRRKRVHFIHYKFLPGLGFYGWGYLHIIGSLGKAASGALRALLDGAATASLQGGFKSKESKVAGEFIFTPGVWKDVDMTAEDLAKSFYTPPFKEPSPALFHTLELLVRGIQEFSTTTEAMTGAGDNKGPVGTTLALIEQGSKVYSGIHKRLHKAARFEFKLIAELNYENMDDEYPYDVVGAERSVFKQDFDGRVDILPVSDPNIYSNVQRMAQAQGTLELIGQDPTLYDDEARRQAHLDMHKALRTPDPERFLPRKVVRRVDPVTENQTMLTGGSAKAFIEQDHASHMTAHQNFMMEVQGMGLEEQMLQAFIISMTAHIAEHYAHAYRLRIEQELGMPMPPVDFQDKRDDEDMPIEIDHAVARAVAQLNPPPPPQGPMDEQAMKEAEHEQKLRHKDEEHQQRMQHEQEEFGVNIQKKQADAQQDAAIKGSKAAQEKQIKAEQAEQDFRKKQADNLLDTAKKAQDLTPKPPSGGSKK